MNKFAKICVKDLETKKYPQTKDKLQARNGACCCLGVVTRRFMQECDHDITTVVSGSCVMFKDNENFQEADVELLDIIREKIGFREASGGFTLDLSRSDLGFKKRLKKDIKEKLRKHVKNNSHPQDTYHESSLADLNDSGFTHPEIAQIIKAEPDGLFEQIS